MASQKKHIDSGSVEDRFSQILSRVFYFEEGEEQSVRHFSDWCKEQGYAISDSKVYDIIRGRSKPGATFIVAILRYSNDVELHQMFTSDKSLQSAVAARVKTAVGMLESVVKSLEKDKGEE